MAWRSMDRGVFLCLTCIWIAFSQIKGFQSSYPHALPLGNTGTFKGFLRLRGGETAGEKQHDDSSQASSNHLLQFWEAARDGNLTALKAYVQSGIEAFAKDSEDMTALHHASICGRIDCCNFLMDLDADLSLSAGDGSTCLHLAAYYGHLEICKLLISRGAPIHARDNDGSQALHNAAYKGQDAICSLLLEEGAEVNSLQDANKLTALHLAVESGHKTTVAILLKAGANATARAEDGRTAVDMAVKAGSVDMLCELLPFLEEAKSGQDRLNPSTFKIVASLAAKCLPEVRKTSRRTWERMPSVVTWNVRKFKAGAAAPCKSKSASINASSNGPSAIAGNRSGGASGGVKLSGESSTDKLSPYLDQMLPGFLVRIIELAGMDKMVAARAGCQLRSKTIKKHRPFGLVSDVVLCCISAAIASRLTRKFLRVVEEGIRTEWAQKHLWCHIPPWLVKLYAYFLNIGVTIRWLKIQLWALVASSRKK